MTKWIVTFVMTAIFVLVMTNKKMEMKAIFNDYQYAKTNWAKEMHVERAKDLMRPSLIPYVLDIYTTGQDIEFAEAMIDCEQSPEATSILWKTAQAPDTHPLTRTICLAHLLNRDQLAAWAVITDDDINTIAGSMPAHVVHWKTLLMKYTGEAQSYFNKDTFPERHKFKALFRECIQIYTSKEEQRKLNSRDLSP